MEVGGDGAHDAAGAGIAGSLLWMGMGVREH